MVTWPARYSVYTLVVNNNQYWKSLSALKDMCILASIQMEESNNNNNKKCAMCGKPASSNVLILHTLGDGVTYAFDSEECAKTFKKFYGVYGKHFTSILD